MVDAGLSYEGCKNMIYKLALDRWARMRCMRPEVDFEDVLGEANMIYAWCLQHYSTDKNTKFTTYLYMQLRGRLRDYYNFTFSYMDLYENMVSPENSGDDTYEDKIISKEYNIDRQVDEFCEDARLDLSYEGNQVLRYILSREWENSRRHNAPSAGQISKKFGYPRPVVESILNEIKGYWLRNASVRSEDFFYNNDIHEKSNARKRNEKKAGGDAHPSALF
jgi:hypothetical protein